MEQDDDDELNKDRSSNLNLDYEEEKREEEKEKEKDEESTINKLANLNLVIVKKNKEKENLNKKVNKNKDNYILSSIENIDANIERKCFRCTGDIMIGITYLGRIILTLYSFHGLFFIYNIIFQYIILFAGVLYDIKNFYFQIIMTLIYILFSLSAGNILVIPTYEFLTFPYMSYRNPFVHLMSFTYIVKDVKFDTEKAIRKNYNIINALLIIIEIAYLIGFLCVWSSLTVVIKDYVKFVILCFMYIYYLLIILSYCFLLIFVMILLLITSYREFSKIAKKTKQFCLTKYWYIFKYSLININLCFSKREELPDINLLSYIINPYLIKNYEFKDGSQLEEKHMEDYCSHIGVYQKLFLLVLTIIIFFILTTNNEDLNFWTLVAFLFLFVVMSTLSIGINFPFCFRNKKTFGNFFAATNYKYKVKMRHPIMLSLVRFVCNLLVLIICLGLVFIFFFMTDSDFHTQEELENLNLKGAKINKLSDATKDKLLPNMCFSSLYYLPIPYFIPFINDAYYFNNGNSSFKVDQYNKLIFSKDFSIEVRDDLIKTLEEKKKDVEEVEEGSVKMIQYNVKAEKVELTILSIKGTSYKKDIFLDIQLYFPSILLSILSTFSLSQKDTLSNKFIEYSLSIPYRIFFQFLIIDKYMDLLIKAYNKNRQYFYQNIIIVGHSLGGGLSKILGRFLKIQAISLSGPGMNAFNSLWEYRGDSEYFGISNIDLVPDMDLVPRVEVSGGTIYRIICTAGVFGCHDKERSFCEVLIMCRHPNYRIYCKEIALLDYSEINDLVNKTELNEN